MLLIPHMLTAGSLAVADDPGGHEEASAPHQNAIGIKGIFAVHLLEERVSAVPGVEAPDADRLGGVVLSYERRLLGEWLALEIAKPFLFGSGRFDSPFDTSLVVMRRFGDVEPFLGVGYTFDVRIFDAEREAIEGRPNALSFGVIGAAGAAIWLGETTALEVEVGFGHVVVGPVVDNELTASTGLAFAF